MFSILQKFNVFYLTNLINKKQSLVVNFITHVAIKIKSHYKKWEKNRKTKAYIYAMNEGLSTANRDMAFEAKSQENIKFLYSNKEKKNQ